MFVHGSGSFQWIQINVFSCPGDPVDRFGRKKTWKFSEFWITWVSLPPKKLTWVTLPIELTEMRCEALFQSSLLHKDGPTKFCTNASTSEHTKSRMKVTNNTVQHSTAQHTTAQHSTAHHTPPQHSTSHHTAPHQNTRQQTGTHTPHNNTTQHNTTQHNTTPHHTTQYTTNVTQHTTQCWPILFLLVLRTQWTDFNGFFFCPNRHEMAKKIESMILHAYLFIFLVIFWVYHFLMFLKISGSLIQSQSMFFDTLDVTAHHRNDPWWNWEKSFFHENFQKLGRPTFWWRSEKF